MPRAVVAVLCGPHDNDGGVAFRRIDRGIAVALKLGAPLLIAGDANGRRDLRLFALRAMSAGVQGVYCEDLYDQRASTLYDVRSVADCLTSEPRLKGIRRVHLVTDSWHMSRALVMLADRLRESLDGHFDIRCENVTCEPSPTPKILRDERDGLQSYLNGTYDPFTIVLPPFGKPEAYRAAAC